MKNQIVKAVVAIVAAVTIVGATSASAYHCAWRNGHRVCWGGYYGPHHCRWVPAHRSHGYWVRGHRVCWR